MTSADRPAKLFDDRFERPAHCPVGIVVAQLAEIGNVANVVAAAVFIHILVREFVAERLFDGVDGFEDRDAVRSAPPRL